MTKKITTTAADRNALSDELDASAARRGNYILIYTDGSCYGNPGPGGYASVLRRMDGATEIKKRVLRGRDPSETTNNRMELTAAIVALELIKPTEPETIVMMCDSEYVAKGVTEWVPNWMANGWLSSGKKAVANRDLWERIIAASTGKAIEWRWVEAHAGNAFNEEVDRLARQQMEKARADSYGFAA